MRASFGIVQNQCPELLGRTAKAAHGALTAKRQWADCRSIEAMRVALYQPDIPQNAGTIMRLCACLDVPVDVIEPAGFPASDRAFRRAGLDYLDQVDLKRHASFAAFDAWRREQAAARLILLTTKADTSHLDFSFAADDILLFGRESAGVPAAVHAAADSRLRIPIRAGLRSLNVAVAAAIVLGEALRQMHGFPASGSVAARTSI
jgi:tRNA (cytidine/uridine-2'-O-)-methyltransferase